MTHRSALLKLATFLFVSALLTGYLAIVVGDISFADRHSYSAMFQNASGIQAGNPVRIAGVEVGKVSSVSINTHSHPVGAIRVSFDVDADIPVPANAHATVRFKNLVGDRFLELEQAARPAVALPPGGVLPVTQTSASLDLDALYNGFKPLFEGLDVQQINTLSSAIVNVLQGQSGAVYTLIANLGSLTGTLAAHDRLIGDVITNLASALETIADRHAGLADLIDQLQHLVSGLASDRVEIGAAVVHIDSLATTAAGLLASIRPNLKADVTSLGAVATTLSQHTDTIQQVLHDLPSAYRTLQRVGSFGSFFNFYVCGLRLKLSGPNGPIYTPFTLSNAARCAKS